VLVYRRPSQARPRPGSLGLTHDFLLQFTAANSTSTAPPPWSASPATLSHRWLLLLTAGSPPTRTRAWIRPGWPPCPRSLLWLAVPRQASPGQALPSQGWGGGGPPPRVLLRWWGRRWRSASAASGGRSSPRCRQGGGEAWRSRWWLPARSCCCRRPLSPLTELLAPATSPTC
jgi:hypothetical protein